MKEVAERFTFNREQICKQTLEKYFKWAKILAAIKNGCNTREELRQRFGLYVRDSITYIKAAGLCVSVGRGMHSYYNITTEGEQLITNVKQFEKEKKNEKI